MDALIQLIIWVIQKLLDTSGGSDPKGKPKLPTTGPMSSGTTMPRQPTGPGQVDSRQSTPQARPGMKPMPGRPQPTAWHAQPGKLTRPLHRPPTYHGGRTPQRPGTVGKRMAASKPTQKKAAKPPAPVAAAPPPPVSARIAQPPAQAAPAISAAAIRRLISSRPGATRTMYVLGEIFQPPMGLRD